MVGRTAAPDLNVDPGANTGTKQAKKERPLKLYIIWLYMI